MSIWHHSSNGCLHAKRVSNTFTHFVLLRITMYHFVMTLYVGSGQAAIILVYMHMDKLAEPSDKCVPVGLLASELQDTSFGSTM